MTQLRTPWLLCSFLLLTGCGPPKTAEFGPAKQYPKEQRPTVWEAPSKDRLGIQDMGPVRGAKPDGQGALTWTGDTPVGFEALPPDPKNFRDAVWRVAAQPDTVIYLTAGVGGGVAGNMARWYTQQFGIEQVPAMESLPVVELAGKPGRLVELKGTMNGKPGWAALIAFLAMGDQVMSFKFTGPESLVVGNKDKFLALAKSLRPGAGSGATAPPIDPGQPLPPGHGPTNGGSPQAPGASPFTATIPAGWTAKAGSSKPLHQSFGKDGEVYVSQLGGPLKGTLDIWRREMGLQTPLTDAEVEALPKIAFLGEDAVLLDLSGDLQGMTRQLAGARLLVAARLDGSTITFAKLVGTASEVAAQADNFRAFCGSVRRAP